MKSNNTITWLTITPIKLATPRTSLAVHFRAHIDSARPVQFTPDSTTVRVRTADRRVEWWDVASRTRIKAFELAGKQSCMQTALSPDGRVLGCIDGRFNVLLFDVDGKHAVQERGRVLVLEFVRFPQQLRPRHMAP